MSALVVAAHIPGALQAVLVLPGASISTELYTLALVAAVAASMEAERQAVSVASMVVAAVRVVRPRVRRASLSCRIRLVAVAALSVPLPETQSQTALLPA